MRDIVAFIHQHHTQDQLKFLKSVRTWARKKVLPSWEGATKRRMMNPIDLLFRRLRSQGRKAFIPFITAGDPDLKATELLIPKLAESGASLIEIGFPYSDPIADGAVIQASYTRALDRGLRIDDILKTAFWLTNVPCRPVCPGKALIYDVKNVEIACC